MHGIRRHPIAWHSLVVATADQVSSDLADEKVVLHLGSGTYYSLNAVGGKVWDLIRTPTRVADLRDTIQKLYRGKPADIEGGLLDLLQHLQAEGLIEVTDEAAP
jgi:hypothetical protein